MTIVRGSRPTGQWVRCIDGICEALDEHEIRRPKTWGRRGLVSWSDALILDRCLVSKAIRHTFSRQFVQAKPRVIFVNFRQLSFS